MGNDCLFCKIARGKLDANIVHADDELVAFEDINPQAPVHLLIIPRAHIVNVGGLQDHQAALAGNMILLAKDLAQKNNILESGFRLVINCNRDGGQAVDHIHLHLMGGRALQWPPG